METGRNHNIRLGGKRNSNNNINDLLVWFFHPQAMNKTIILTVVENIILHIKSGKWYYLIDVKANSMTNQVKQISWRGTYVFFQEGAIILYYSMNV